MADMISSWTDEREIALRTLYHRGYSASQIAAAIGGVSRNAVIGKCHRLHFEKRLRARNSMTDPKFIETPGLPLTIIELRNETCRWPIANGLYCGRPEADLSAGRPYCRHHAAIAFQKR